MNRRNILFVQIALLSFLVGSILGLVMLWRPDLLPGQPWRIHGHLMLLGFVTMMIYGVAIHVLPRFSGRALYSNRMADFQLVSAGLGLLLMCIGWLVADGRWFLALGGFLELTAALLFGVNIALTMIRYQPVVEESLEGSLVGREEK